MIVEFKSVYEARLANYHGEFTDEKKYSIAKYKVTYELIEEDCDIEEENKEYYKEDLKRVRGF